MPTAFCGLDEAYGDWTSKNSKNNIIPSAMPMNNSKQNQNKQDNQDKKDNQGAQKDSEMGVRSFCPNCQNCLDANNVLQQKIIDQNIWPRPRWVPQYPNSYELHDPYNRYWMNLGMAQAPQGLREDFVPNLSRENFGFGFGSGKNNLEAILQLILFILIALFIIHFFEMIFKMT